MPSPAPQASNTAQGEGVPALLGLDVKSLTVSEVLLSRWGVERCSASVSSVSADCSGREDLNRRGVVRRCREGLRLADAAVNKSSKFLELWGIGRRGWKEESAREAGRIMERSAMVVL